MENHFISEIKQHGHCRLGFGLLVENSSRRMDFALLETSAITGRLVNPKIHPWNQIA
jgi:hypothetical protein